MKLLIGLGNPGEKYKNNRHNAGFILLDILNDNKWQKSKRGLLMYSWLDSDVELIKPLTFMNDSGIAVKYVVNKHKIKPKDIFIIHDDLDIPLGSYKIQFGRGPKEHNGLNDIYDKLGTRDFWHIRIGVDSRDHENRIKGQDYVLQDFTDQEEIIFKRTIKDLIYDLLKNYLNKG